PRPEAAPAPGRRWRAPGPPPSQRGTLLPWRVPPLLSVEPSGGRDETSLVPKFRQRPVLRSRPLTPGPIEGPSDGHPWGRRTLGSHWGLPVSGRHPNVGTVAGRWRGGPALTYHRGRPSAPARVRASPTTPSLRGRSDGTSRAPVPPVALHRSATRRPGGGG